MTKQPILDELHEIREKMLAEAGGSLAALIEKLRADQANSGHEIRRSQTKARYTEAAKPDSLVKQDISSRSGER